MSWRTRAPLVVVVDEVTEWSHLHGTKAELQPDDLIEPGHAANFGPAPRMANFVYFTRTLDASVCPLRVIRQYTEWEGHSPESVRAMKEGLARLEQAGFAPDDGWTGGLEVGEAGRCRFMRG